MTNGLCAAGYIRRPPGAGELEGQLSEAKGPYRKELDVWIWLVVVVVAGTAVLLAQWMDRSRGSQGESRRLDLPGTKDGRPRHIDTNDGFNGM